MWLIRLLLFIIAIVILIGFVLYNPDQHVDLHFPWGSYYGVLLIFVCFGAFLLGMLVSFIYSVFYYIRIAGDIREKNKQMRQLEMELSALRNRSLEDLEETPGEQKEQDS